MSAVKLFSVAAVLIGVVLALNIKYYVIDSDAPRSTEFSKELKMRLGFQNITTVSYADGLRSSMMVYRPTEMPPKGEVIFLHGFPDTFESFKDNVQSLVDEGYLCLAPMLRGYEKSSVAADGNYYVLTLAKDIIELMDVFGLEKVHIVGHDWGSTVAQAAARISPERFHSVTLMAVPNLKNYEQVIRQVPEQLRNSWYMLFFQLPLLPELALRFGGLVDKLYSDWCPTWGADIDAETAPFKKLIEDWEVLQAVIGYYRCNIVRPMLKVFGDVAAEQSAINKKDIPVPYLTLAGDDDGCLRRKIVEAAEEGVGELIVVPGVGHFLHREDPNTINAHLVRWINKHN